MSEPKAEQPESMPDSKSGICGPAGYNGKTPSSIAAPVKSYPGSASIGKSADKSGKGGGMVVGPMSNKASEKGS